MMYRPAEAESVRSKIGPATGGLSNLFNVRFGEP